MDRLTVALFFLVSAGGCTSSPTAPAQPPPPPPAALQITCPTSLTQQSSTGGDILVHFDQPSTSGGTAPVQVSCTPPNDSVFPIGSKNVTCTATDAKSVTAQCSFTVTLTAPPRIASTRFVAFGDSMTAGEVVSEGFGGIRTLLVDLPKSYPSLLQNLLKNRYVAQAGGIQVANAGKSGEVTSAGLLRLPTQIDGGAYEVLLLMEGVNDFPDYQTALANMRAMVQYGKRRNVRVLVATVPPERPTNNTCGDHGKNWAFVDPYNNGLRAIIASEGVTLVDVNGDFHGDTTTLIDCDGLHPTPAGYSTIAQSFFNAIKSTLEVPPPTTTAMPLSGRRTRR